MDYYELDKLDGYRYDAPYPKIKVIAPNNYYGEILLDDYSGIDSEMTCISQYQYHYYTTKHVDPEICYHLAQIAKVEQIHMEILAEILVRLKVYPVYRCGYCSNQGYWNGQRLGYGRTLLEQLNLDLDLEYRTIRNYNTHIRLINDPFIKSVLNRLVKDEEVHAMWFRELIRQYS